MKCVVTGGGGFVGSALCSALVREGHSVVAIGRREIPALKALGVQTVQHDLATAPEALATLCADAAVVFHTAAHVAMWGRYKDFFCGNILATRHCIAACRTARVPVLIYTSSPAVIADGSHLRGVDETYPYPRHYNAHYPATKAVAEREVLQANGSGLTTAALRPHLIFGPGDTNLVPTILKRAKAGRLVRVGNGTNRVDLTFIDDCVAAHLGAWRTAQSQVKTIGGKAFFISQDDPTLLWKWIDHVLSLHGLPPVTRSLSVGVARGAAFAIEGVWSLLGLGLGLRSDPPLTRFLASEMSTDHFFSIARARSVFDYQPQYSVMEATERTFTSLR